VVLAGLAVLAAGALFLRVRLLDGRITPANFERIHRGMTRAEVEAILGPPGDFTAKVSFVYYPPTDRFTLPGPPKRAYQEWITDAHGLMVGFDSASGLVEEICYLEVHPAQQSVFERLLWPIQRVCRRWLP
jgi:hypothetical protein